MACPNLVNFAIVICPKLVKKSQKRTLLNLLKVRKMTKVTCPELKMVTSNLVGFCVDAEI